MRKKKIKIANVVIASVFFHLLSSHFISAQTVADIVDQASSSVVMIVTYDATGSASGQGSGVFITDGGIILTNFHVLGNAYSAEVYTDSLLFEDVTVLYEDELIDLALIWVNFESSNPMRFPDVIKFRPGDRVIAIGNPLGLERTISDGLISGIRETADGVELIQTSVPISPGSSGGILLNEKGEFLGITASTFEEGQNINFAISVNSITTFLNDYVVQNPDGEKNRDLEHAGESVWYRVALKWIGGIFVFLIALLFGGGYFVILILTLGGYLLYWIFIGLRWLVTLPFRSRESEEMSEYYSNNPEISDMSNLDFTKHHNSGLNNVVGIDEVIDEFSDDEHALIFHCWKCGNKIALLNYNKGESIECNSCLTVLIIPGE